MSRPTTKAEFPPLLEQGRHVYTLDSLRKLCVDAFPASTTRAEIMDKICEVVNRLEAAGVVGDLWIDGSFLTKKIDPDDVDVALRMDALLYDSSGPDFRGAVDWLNSNLYDTHKVDSYVFFIWPAGHPLFWLGEYSYVYWMKQWGFSRKDTRKGIAEIKLTRSVP